jgi:GTPase SAR1 family protein
MRDDFTAEQKLASLMGGRAFDGKTAPATAIIPALRDGDLHLGDTAANIPIGINLAKLIDGRLLIQGNSGAGKSMLLRRLFEQAFGRVQQLLIDSDGEFSTLAENFDVAVLAAIDVLRVGPRKFALHLREHRYSAVLDLSDATSEQRLDIVADVAAGLIDAPERHWHPLLVLVDEAQTFAPHYDTGDVEADTRKRAIAALADLMGRGRKRGIAGVIATQRLAETSKAVVSKATNIIAGRTIFDRDLERAGALLGFTVGQSRPLRTLTDGEFLCLGPAIAGPKRVRFRTGPVKSRHKGRAPTMVEPPKITAAAAAGLLKSLPPAAASSAPAGPGHAPKRGRRGRDWLQAEDQIIRDGYNNGASIAQIGAQLAAIGFSTSTANISTRAHALGLTSAKAAVAWTDREDEIIRDGYVREVKLMDIVGLLEAEGFHRGRVAVQMRAINLNITRDRVNYWTEAEKEIALRGLEDGTPYREIIANLKAAGFHRGSTSIFKFATKHNFKRGPDPWTHEEIAKMTELYKQKTPVKQIAEILQKPIAAIRSRASNMGLKQRVAWSEEEYEILRRCHEDGESLGMASQKIGRPYPNVARVAIDIGLNFKAQRPASDSKPQQAA